MKDSTSSNKEDLAIGLLGITVALIIISTLILPPLPSILPHLSGPPKFPQGGGPLPDHETARVSVFVNPLNANILPGENGNISILVKNKDTHNSTMSVKISAENKPDISAIRSPTRNSNLDPGEQTHWTLPVRLNEGLQSIEVTVLYNFSDSSSGQEFWTTETVVFSKSANKPTLEQRIWAFVIVSLYTMVALAHIDRRALSGETSGYTFVGIGIGLGSFAASTELSELIVESFIGTGLIAFTILGIVLYYHQRDMVRMIRMLWSENGP